MAKSTATQSATLWILEGYDEERRVFRRVPITPLPFVVGRQQDLPLPLNRTSISRQHAELFVNNGELYVRDLGSRNGTFVNRTRIDAAHHLRAGDVVHFGTCEFRIWNDPIAESADYSETMEFKGTLPEHFAAGTREFLELLRFEAVECHYQPLVRLGDQCLFGYEMLGRGAMHGAPRMPSQLFAIAAECNMEGELSRLFRSAGVRGATKLDSGMEIFMNVHPVEMMNLSALLDSLAGFRKTYPTLQFTVEIHESLITDPASMRDFRARLKAMGIKIAYDDFGAGQARLMELSEVPPDYLKFDRSLIQDLHQAPSQRKQMVEMLVGYARGLGVTTLAEGIENEAEAAECVNLGFECAQGYFFGRPHSADQSATQA